MLKFNGHVITRYKTLDGFYSITDNFTFKLFLSTEFSITKVKNYD